MDRRSHSSRRHGSVSLCRKQPAWPQTGSPEVSMRPSRLGARKPKVNSAKAPRKRRIKFTAPQVIGFSATFAFFLLIYIIGPDFILPSQTTDAQTVADMATNLDDISNGAGGYYYTAYLLSLLPPGGEQVLVIGVGLLFIGTVFSHTKTFPTAALASFLCTTPILMFLFAYMKDTFTPILTSIALLLLSRNRNLPITFLLVLATYISYGIFFRTYYILIAAAFAGLLIFHTSNWYFRLVLATVALAALLLLPDAYFYELGSARDLVNRHRPVDTLGNRTVFFNPYPPTNALNFTINYVYAIIRLNLPFLFSFGLKESFLVINIAIYAILVRVGFSSSHLTSKMPVILFCAHILVLYIFEPDLGSYLRHASSALLYLTPALTVLDKSHVSLITHRRRPRRSNKISQLSSRRHLNP